MLVNAKYKSLEEFKIWRVLFTWPFTYDWMNMTEYCEYDQIYDNDEHYRVSKTKNYDNDINIEEVKTLLFVCPISLDKN